MKVQLTILLFFVTAHKFEKRKIECPFLYAIMKWEDKKRKDGIYSKVGIADHIPNFRFFVFGLGKRKRVFRYPFLLSIMKKKREKRKDGKYTDAFHYREYFIRCVVFSYTLQGEYGLIRHWYSREDIH